MNAFNGNNCNLMVITLTTDESEQLYPIIHHMTINTRLQGKTNKENQKMKILLNWNVT